MDVVSMSLGTATYSQALNDTSANAYNAGILLVAAAGNGGDGNLSMDDVQYPAKFDSVIAVLVVDFNNLALVWSADSEKIELAAPFVSGVAAPVNSRNLFINPHRITYSPSLFHKKYDFIFVIYHH